VKCGVLGASSQSGLDSVGRDKVTANVCRQLRTSPHIAAATTSDRACTLLQLELAPLPGRSAALTHLTSRGLVQARRTAPAAVLDLYMNVAQHQT
jgi:hypothetical protein